MGLNLKELVELAMLDAVMDHPVAMADLMSAGTPWHELSGRSDVRGMMGAVLHRLLDQGEFSVSELHEGQPGASLVGSEAAMVIERASKTPELLHSVRISVTDEGKAHYRVLAKRYYNG